MIADLTTEEAVLTARLHRAATLEIGLANISPAQRLHIFVMERLMRNAAYTFARGAEDEEWFALAALHHCRHCENGSGLNPQEVPAQIRGHFASWDTAMAQVARLCPCFSMVVSACDRIGGGIEALYHMSARKRDEVLQLVAAERGPPCQFSVATADHVILDFIIVCLQPHGDLLGIGGRHP